MSLFTDIEYLHQISYQLPRFKRIDDRTFNCRCPICGDSQKNPNKARGYFYQHGQRLNYKCHNCQLSTTFRSFLKKFDQNTFDSYIRENYKNDNETVNTRKKIVRKTSPIVTEPPTSPVDEEKNEIDTSVVSPPKNPFKTVLDLSDDHPVIEYMLSRKIPLDKYGNFFYIDHMIDIVKDYPKYKELIRTDEMRIVIPFHDKNGVLIGATCRALDDSITPRYVELKFDEESTLAFGMDTVNTKDTVYIVEGAIDSCFVDNSIAVAGMAMQKIKALGLQKENCVLVLDNQPKHRDVVSAMDKFINDGYKVCIWPSVLEGKDINAMVIHGELDEDDVTKIIRNNTFSGLKARLNFNNWKRI